MSFLGNYGGGGGKLSKPAAKLLPAILVQHRSSQHGERAEWEFSYTCTEFTKALTVVIVYWGLSGNHRLK